MTVDAITPTVFFRERARARDSLLFSLISFRSGAEMRWARKCACVLLSRRSDDSGGGSGGGSGGDDDDVEENSASDTR